MTIHTPVWFHKMAPCLLPLLATAALITAAPIPVQAQDAANTASSSGSPALVSLFLLVIGLLAVGIIATRVVILPGVRTRLSAASFAEDDGGESSIPDMTHTDTPDTLR